MKKEAIMPILVLIFIGSIGLFGLNAIFGSMSVASLTTGLGEVSTAMISETPGSLMKVQAPTYSDDLPNLALKATETTSLSTAVALGNSGLSIAANGQNITFSGNLDTVPAVSLRYLTESAKEVVGGVVALPNFTKNNALPAIYQKSTQQYLRDGIIAMLNLHESYAYDAIMKMSQTELQALAKALHEGDATHQPLIGVCRPNVYDIKVGKGVNNGVVKGRGGVLLEVYTVDKSIEQIKTKIPVTTIVTAEVQAALIDAIRGINTGYIFMPVNKFPVDSSTGAFVIR